jgi:hypothetical protein
MDWTAAGVIVTALALIVTIVIFGIQSARARQATIEANRRALVGRVIDSVEKAARAHVRFPFGHVRSSVEFEFAIVLPRLLVELNKDERPVAYWVGEKVQRMQAASLAKDTIPIAFEVALKLASWHSGDIKTSWFSEQLSESPMRSDFRTPRRVRFARQFWYSVEVAKVTAIAALTLLAGRYMIRKAEE